MQDLDEPHERDAHEKTQRKRTAATSSSSSRRHRKLSTLDLVHDLHASEELRQRQEADRQRQEAEWRRHVQQLMDASQSQWRTQYDQIVRDLQAQHDDAQLQRQQQEEQSLKAVEAQLAQQQRELDQQFLTFTNTFLAAQSVQEQQIARILESLREHADAFVSRGDLEQLAASWMQSARDDCVYGANAETLAALQGDLARLRDMLHTDTTSPVLVELQQEITRVLELLQRILELLERDASGLHGLAGAQMMQTLRVVVGQLEELAHNARDDDASAEQTSALLAEMTRRMEMGTASLLHALETQQEQYQRALAQQQTAIEALQRDVHEQRASATELRQQLAACPNQEDTLRIITALREQIQLSAADTTSRMLDTVDDLRAKMNGLPTLEFLDKLLHSKADRSEIDRLRLLLASTASAPAGPNGPSLAKSPTRCLSCDQSLPFLRSRPPSAHLQHIHDRPSTALEPGNLGGAGDDRVSRSASPRHPTHAPPGVAASHMSTAQATWLQERDARSISNQLADSPFARAIAEADDGALSTQDILNDLARTIAAAKRRRQRHQLQAQLEEHAERLESLSSQTPGKRRSLAMVSDEDRKNRIPLRRPTLSDQVIYGPTITSGFLKPRRSVAPLTTSRGSPSSAAGESSNEPRASSRPKTAIVPERRSGGDVILRAPTTTRQITLCSLEYTVVLLIMDIEDEMPPWAAASRRRLRAKQKQQHKAPSAPQLSTRTSVLLFLVILAIVHGIITVAFDFVMEPSPPHVGSSTGASSLRGGLTTPALVRQYLGDRFNATPWVKSQMDVELDEKYNELCLMLHSDHTEPTLGDPPASCYSRQAVQRILIDLVLTTSAVFTQHEIVHFLDSGTFLGAVRHGSVIPFDQDADMGIDLAGYEYLKTHRVELPAGYVLHVFDSALYPRGSRYIQLPVRVVHVESKLYLDVFVYLDSVDATGQRITGPMPSGSYVNCVHCAVLDEVTMSFKVPFDWIYPLTRCRFADYDLNCPREAEKYLRYMFGDDFMTPQEYE
ncbi:hypothetical protein ATCC90586_000745 [Pythium insidiosum]|nr:hypothetical protein ATCC90586_000745 [Pythium insidiosum]